MAMETIILIQSGPKPNAVFPPDQNWSTGLKEYACLKVLMHGRMDGCLLNPMISSSL